MNEKKMQIEWRLLSRVISMQQNVGAKILGSALLLLSLCGAGRYGVCVMTENARRRVYEKWIRNIHHGRY